MHPRQFPKQQPPRDNWRVEVVEQKTEGGLVLFEYAIREAQKDPFLLNNHRAQIRTNHHRIVTGPNGGLMHVSGVEVLDLEEFEKGADLYRWADKDRSGNWRDDRGRTLAPFMFPAAPWAGGRDEELDPQWVRETFVLSEAAQVAACVDRYQKRAERKAYVGDRRGTTLNLQVGASADDADQTSADAVSITSTSVDVDSTTEHFGWRWDGIAIAPGSAIDDAILQVMIRNSTTDEPLHQVRAEAADDAPVFSTASNDIDARSRTTATVQWNSTGLGSAGANFEEWGCATTGGAGSSIESIVQEVIDRGGWASGNAIVLIAEQHTNNGTRDLGVWFYDTDSSWAAKLDIDYTAGGGGALPHLFRNHTHTLGAGFGRTGI